MARPAVGSFAWMVVAAVVGASGAPVSYGQCTTNAQCHNDNNVCTCDRCINSVCFHTPTVYGNVNCDTVPMSNVDDILCALNGFSNFASCPNADLKPDCTGNNLITIDDILGVQAAFSGANPCNCGIGSPCLINADCSDGEFCNGVETCVGGFCMSGTDPCPGQFCSEAADVCAGAGNAVMTCELSAASAPRGTSVNLEVFLESVNALRGYEASILITKVSGPGSLTPNCPTGVQVDISRSDFVFFNSGATVNAADCPNLRAASALFAGGVNVTTPPKYLMDATLNISADSSSCTTYQIQVQPSPSSLLRDTANNSIPFITGPLCILQVTGNSGVDCNSNGIPDECEPDCQPNGIADSCDIAGPSNDCDLNLVPDECDPDCQPNGIPDACDINLGTSDDCNNNDVPDECDPNDCQLNDVPDTCDIANGTSTDCNTNGLPDECDLALGVGSDCQPNGVFDECEIDMGTSLDLNGNGIPDECDALCAAGCNDNNVCTCDRCLSGLCSNTNRKYGDVNCNGGNVDLDDILCSLAGFASIADCRNADIAPLCTGNNVINLDDILRVLAAFAGQSQCGCLP